MRGVYPEETTRIHDNDVQLEGETQEIRWHVSLGGKEEQEGKEWKKQNGDSYRHKGMILRMADSDWWVMAPSLDQGYDGIRREFVS